MERTYGRLWVPGDWNGFFGLFTNVLTNVMVLSGLLLFVVQMPAEIVYGRVVPAVGVASLFGNLYYAYAARRLAQKEKRHDVTALAYGVSVPHMFIVVFLVVGPIYWTTNNAILAWQGGMAWALIQGIVEVAGAAIGPAIRKFTPRAAILGTLAGVSIAFIAMRPTMQVFEVPYIGFVSLAIILLSWLGNRKFPYNIPAGLVAIVVGTALGWLTGHMDVGALSTALAEFRFTPPMPWLGDLMAGLSVVAPYLVTAIPLGVYNFMETMSNVESAAVAGDNYNTREAMLVDGVGTLIGVLFGSVFPTAVYIGHPGWKQVGARIGYSIATGVCIFAVSVLGILPVLLNIVPLVAILPILLFIGLIIGAQAFQAVPRAHAPAVVLALIPWLANWGRTQVDGALGAAGLSAAEVGLEALANQGVLYRGMAALGEGAILTGLILAAVAAFIIDNKLRHAAAYAAIGAVLSWFGVIHAPQLGFGMAPGPALGYVLVVVVLLAMSRFTSHEAHGVPSEEVQN
ncbi:MAG: NCS2 family permease [Thermaerobacter sp.]|nr:NCS2 family permease [Thermaerobacter sp.]